MRLSESDRVFLDAVMQLIAHGFLECERAYRKSEIVRIIGGGVEASEYGEKAFRCVRRLAERGASAGGLTVEIQGPSAYRRYVLRYSNQVPEQSPHAPSAQADSAGARPWEAPYESTPHNPHPHDHRHQSAPSESTPGMIQVLYGDNLHHLPTLPSDSYRLIYVDPPFNTGRIQARTQFTTVRDESQGDRVGFKGQRYRSVAMGQKAFDDSFDDYLGFLYPRLAEAYRLLTPDGSLFVHLDCREVHYAKVMLDQIFGRECFQNEIIWAYDYGARARKKWSSKHDNILWYVKNPDNYVFNYEEMDRIPYMAPGLVGPSKAARGKTPTDVWWHTIVSPNGREKTGYPTQKPVAMLKRFVRVHSMPGDQLLDFFGGSGTFGEAGASLGRHVTLIDKNPEALGVMYRRLEAFAPYFVGDAAYVAEHTARSQMAEAHSAAATNEGAKRAGVPWGQPQQYAPQPNVPVDHGVPLQNSGGSWAQTSSYPPDAVSYVHGSAPMSDATTTPNVEHPPGPVTHTHHSRDIPTSSDPNLSARQGTTQAETNPQFWSPVSTGEVSTQKTSTEEEPSPNDG